MLQKLKDIFACTVGKEAYLNKRCGSWEVKPQNALFFFYRWTCQLKPCSA